MSDQNQSPFSLQRLNRPWPATHPANAIRTADIIMIAVVVVCWVGFLSLQFDGKTNYDSNWVLDDAASTQRVFLGITLSALAYCAIFAGLLVLARVRGYTIDTFMLRPAPVVGILIAIAGFFVVSSFGTALRIEANGQPGMGNLFDDLTQIQQVILGNSIVGLAYGVVLGLLNPLALHLVFRGWVYGWLRCRMNTWFAALIASLLFASVQVATYDSILEHSTLYAGCLFAAVFVLTSFVICIVTELTRSLWPGGIIELL